MSRQTNTGTSYALPQTNPVALFGVNNSNLYLIERLLGVKIHAMSSQLWIEGSEEARLHASKLLDSAQKQMMNHGDLSLQDIEMLYESLQPGWTYGQMNYLEICHRQRIYGRTPRQWEYLRKLLEFDLNLGIGPAGTGKTYLAIAVALHLLYTKQVARLILTRPIVEAGEKLGFLPGTLEEKIDPYLKPLFDAVQQMCGHQSLTELLQNGTIEIIPLAYMRGRTLTNSCVILDEAQNVTRAQMKMFLTRMGEGSKFIITGDISQTDLPLAHAAVSGLQEAVRLLQPIPAVSITEFSRTDVVRHPLVQAILEAYEGLE